MERKIYKIVGIEELEKAKQLFVLRKRVLQAEQERIDNVQNISVAEARKRLRERVKEK